MKIKIHPTTLVGFKHIVETFESKESKKNKDGNISISLNNASKYMSPIAVEILTQIKLDTILQSKK
jgi:hypothetical protein